jgi:hypothetical protein
MAPAMTIVKPGALLSIYPVVLLSYGMTDAKSRAIPN